MSNSSGDITWQIDSSGIGTDWQIAPGQINQVLTVGQQILPTHQLVTEQF